MDGQKTLLIVCEEGIEEYDEKKMNDSNVFIEYIEDESEYTSAKLMEMSKKYQPERVIVEYNGMWKMDTFMTTRPPYGWEMEQWITTIDATTFDTYVANMRPMIMAMIQDADNTQMTRSVSPSKRYTLSTGMEKESWLSISGISKGLTFRMHFSPFISI